MSNGSDFKCDSKTDSFVTVAGKQVDAGLEWQCVELVNRLMLTRGWSPVAIYGNGMDFLKYAPDKYFVKHANGTGTPVPGDVLVMTAFDQKLNPWGHVAIVDSVDGSSIQVVDQNASMKARATLSWDGTRIGNYGTSEYVTGFLHAIANVVAPPKPAVLTAADAANHILHVAATGTSYAADAQGHPHWIPDGYTYDCLTARGVAVLEATQAQVDGLGNGQPWQPRCMSKGDAASHILRVPSTGTSYLADASGVPHWIKDGGTYNCLVAKGYAVIEVAQEQVDSIGNGQPWATCGDSMGGGVNPPVIPPVQVQPPVNPPVVITPPPPATFAETTGGVAHTWSNPANAGGVAGPVIASNATVAISCKLNGFTVSDGNTWWYRIASDPWNNAYYVSADAFFNNGWTSGSLNGTPYVDPAVPNC